MSEDKLSNIQELLEDIKGLLFLSNQDKIEEAKSKLLKPGSIEESIYKLCDGENSQDQIVEKGKVAAGSVSKYWREWEKIGIGEQIPVKRGMRFKHSFDLGDFGLLPTSSKKETKHD